MSVRDFAPTGSVSLLVMSEVVPQPFDGFMGIVQLVVDLF